MYGKNGGLLRLSKRNYYGRNANEEYMSYSQFKSFSECPARAMAELRGEWKREPSTGMLVGSYVDAWLDGEKELSDFRTQHPEMFTKKGELTAPFRQAEEICRVIENDPYLFGLLHGLKRQKILTGFIAGVPFKCKLDSETPRYVVDGKVLANVDEVWSEADGMKVPFYMAYRYDLQNAIYKTLWSQNNGGKTKDFIFAVVTKEKTPDKRLFRISDETVEAALAEVAANAPRYQAMKEGKTAAPRCGGCDYCRATKMLDETKIEEV